MESLLAAYDSDADSSADEHQEEQPQQPPAKKPATNTNNVQQQATLGLFDHLPQPSSIPIPQSLLTASNEDSDSDEEEIGVIAPKAVAPEPPMPGPALPATPSKKNTTGSLGRLFSNLPTPKNAKKGTVTTPAAAPKKQNPTNAASFVGRVPKTVTPILPSVVAAPNVLDTETTSATTQEPAPKAQQTPSQQHTPRQQQTTARKAAQEEEAAPVGQETTLDSLDIQLPSSFTRRMKDQSINVIDVVKPDTFDKPEILGRDMPQGVGGGLGGTGVTRNQKRKHQLSWLGAQYQEQRQGLEDANSKGLLTKKQVWSKYGW